MTKHNAGYTVAELVAALAVLALGVGAISALVVASHFVAKLW